MKFKKKEKEVIRKINGEQKVNQYNCCCKQIR